jgi:hypothetical protein
VALSECHIFFYLAIKFPSRIFALSLLKNKVLHEISSTEKINGGWTDFGDWSECREMSEGNCGRGVQYRYRTCTNPTPSENGRPCRGKDFDGQKCRVECVETGNAVLFFNLR